MSLNINELEKNNISYSKTTKSEEEKQEIINKLKELLPEVFNSDNILDINKLKDYIDITKTTANNQGYELTFAGKGFAKAKATEETKKELKIEEKQSKNFDTTNNIIIRGDNLDCLKLLNQSYHNKIKMIYIDPQYNTGNDGDFVYNDDFKSNDNELIDKFGLNEETREYLSNIYGTRQHSSWLSFMYPRLKLARDLLTDDGVIFISIDDNEMANLKLLCDEIFGESNFVKNMIRKTKSYDRTKSDAEFQDLYDYILCYGKDKNNLKFNLVLSGVKEYNYEDKKGKYRLTSLQQPGGQHATREERPNLYYSIYYNKKTCEFSTIQKDNFIEILPKKIGTKDGCWMWSKEKFNNDNKDCIVKDDKIFIKRYYDENEDQNKYKHIEPLLLDFHNSKGTINLNELELQDSFSFSKPVELIKFLINTLNNQNSIILDFFAGSGTTAQAVLELNKEDGGNRKFILCQLDEEIDKNKEAYKFVLENKLNEKRDNFSPVISDITIERINRAGEKIKKEIEEENKKNQSDLLNNNEIKNLDIGYKVFSLIDKTKINKSNENFVLNNNRKVFDILYNMMINNSTELTEKIEEIEENKLYLIKDTYYILDKCDLEKIQDKDRDILIDGYSNSIDLQFILNVKAKFSSLGDKKNNKIRVVF